MISLGSVRWTADSPNITLSFAYEKQRSGADMQYRAQITVATVSGSSYFGYPIYLNLSIGGTQRESVTLKTAYPSQWTTAITYTSAWYTVASKTTGTTPVSFNVYSGLGSSRTATFTYDMGVDPAASNISAPNGTLGTALTISLTRYNSNFTDTITYKCGNVTGTVVSGSKSSSVAWNTSNGNTVALAAQNTTGQSVEVTFTVTTYSGSTPVGTNTTKVIMAVPSSVKPSVALSITDAAEYLSTYGAYVQGFSKLTINAIPTLAQGTPIKTYVISADGTTYYTTPVTTPALKGKGTLTVTARVTDTRDRTSDTVSQSITVLEYAKPIVNVSAYRCNSSGGADSEGAYMKISFSSTISSLNGKNSATYKVVYPGGTATGSGTSYTSGVLSCPVTSTHNIEVTVTDRLSSTTRATVVPIAFTLMDYYATGKGVAFGKVATRDGFDCAMPAYFTGGFTVSATPLTSSNNLNDIRVSGWYQWEWDNPPVNAPSGDGTSRMRAMRVWDNGNECCQEVIDMTSSSYHGAMVRRTMSGSTIYPWEWDNPLLTVDVEYRTTERYNGKPVYVKLIDFGTLPNNSYKTISFYANSTSRPISVVGQRGADYDSLHMSLPSATSGIDIFAVNYAQIRAITSVDASDQYARALVKYWKTTD